MRPKVHGKSLWLGEQKLNLHGVTYGTFRSGPDAADLPPRAAVADDFGAMAAAGINCVRTYTPPPEWLLDTAEDEGLLVLAGLPWEQHVAFLERASAARAIESRVHEAARPLAGHPALLGYAVGNEVPAPIARWHGRRKIEGFIERLYEGTKEVDPDALVTYVNYPTTEYLQLPFLDFACFNVYLEARRTLEAYIARLHNLVGDHPLVMAELGLDSRRNGEEAQARSLEWQLDTAFDAGCAGAFAFAWTDEWHRGGFEVDDWDFGLVDRERRPKLALESVARAYFRAAEGDPLRDWPRITAAVCSYNGERWLPGCLDALERVEYPDWELVVVSDGSVDRTDAIARERGVRLIRSDENRGLANARNLALEAATGEIIAYLDDDARPDPDWLKHLALAFQRSAHSAIGGPNLPPPEARPVAHCVASAPGGPIHILLGDDIAEHVPGCNMAIRRDRLLAIGGFDPRYRIAGDDVDACWRVQEEGHTIGFSPAAVVWHHCRPSVRTYLRQQREYGKAEGLLHKKWPERYNRIGHLSWSGRVYGRGRALPSRSRRAKVRYGTWGNRLFQSIYSPADGLLRSLPAMPEWYLLVAGLAVLTMLGLDFQPLLVIAPLLVASVAALLATAIRGASAGARVWRGEPLHRRMWMRALTTALHALQPLARLTGRLRTGLSPWRRRAHTRLAFPTPHHVTMWSEQWAQPDRWLGNLESRLHTTSHGVVRGSEFDRWDLQVRGGALGVMRLLSTVEEHGGGKQLARFRVWPRYSRIARMLLVIHSGLAVAAGLSGDWIACGILAAFAATVAGWAVHDCAAAAGTVAVALEVPLVDGALSPAGAAPAVRTPMRQAANGVSPAGNGNHDDRRATGAEHSRAVR